MDEGQNARNPNRSITISCDEEAWVLDTLRRLALIVTAINQVSYARQTTREHAIYGAVHGAASEILLALGMDCKYENIRRNP